MCPISFSYDLINLQIQLTRDQSTSPEDENMLIDSITVESSPQFGTGEIDSEGQVYPIPSR